MIFSGLKGIAFPLIVGVTGVSAGGGFSLASYLSNSGRDTSKNNLEDFSGGEKGNKKEKQSFEDLEKKSEEILHKVLGVDASSEIKSESEDEVDDYSNYEIKNDESSDSTDSSLIVVAQYIQKENSNYGDREEERGPICTQWFKGKNFAQRMKLEKCKTLVSEKFQGETKQPEIWISSEKDSVTKVLKTYSLINEESVKVTDSNKWTVSAMTCTKQNNLEDSKLLITCEYTNNLEDSSEISNSNVSQK